MQCLVITFHRNMRDPNSVNTCYIIFLVQHIRISDNQNFCIPLWAVQTLRTEQHMSKVWNFELFLLLLPFFFFLVTKVENVVMPRIQYKNKRKLFIYTAHTMFCLIYLHPVNCFPAVSHSTSPPADRCSLADLSWQLGAIVCLMCATASIFPRASATMILIIDPQWGKY